MSDDRNAAQEEIPPEFECSICMKLLMDPVTVSCGHTFCRVCLQQSLGYRNLCAVCRAPVAAGQGVNILVRGIIADRFPQMLARRRQEAEEELHAQEEEADAARRQDATGAQGRRAADAGVLPLLERPDGTLCLPHCEIELEFATSAESRLLAYALQGGRRVGVLDASLAEPFDDAARPMGVCLEVVHARQGHRTTVRLAGKHRFWLTEAPQMHEDGFALGRCEPFFDEPLQAGDLRGGAEESEPAEADAVEAAVDVAREALVLLEAQCGNIGHSGRAIFQHHFGDLPVLPPQGQPTTSTALERTSFYLLGALMTDVPERRSWLASRDSKARLQHCRKRLALAGSRPVLNLPGASSWMSPSQSGFKSLALLVVIIALIVAKALGLFERDSFRRISWKQHNEHMHDTMIFGQLLR